MNKNSSNAMSPSVVIKPGVYGSAEIQYNVERDCYLLTCNGLQWMATDKDLKHSIDTLHSQYDLAYGDVLLTGLGFGILAIALAEKEEVNSVTVLEISNDVIDAFTSTNKLNDKIKIIQADASTYVSSKKYDCLLPDHYELQTIKWKIADMNRLAEAVPHDVFWPWSVEEIFLHRKYPQEKIEYPVEKFFTDNSSSIFLNWKAFIAENFNGHPTLLNISEDKLMEYLGKYAKYHYR